MVFLDIIMTKYLTPKEAQEKYGFHSKTLGRWAAVGKIEAIRSPGGHYRYSDESLSIITDRNQDDTREVVLYCRVSTASQKDDQRSQADYLSKNYPQLRVISDIGSGLNFKRKQFIILMERVGNNEVKKIVVAHKDRLARFGFDFIEWYCLQHQCTIEVLNNTYKTPHQELMDDFMAIMHCFSSKLYFLRRYKDEIKKDVDKELKQE